MARKPKKQPQQPEPAKSFDEFVDEAEAVDDDVGVDNDPHAPSAKLRDWRDVEKYKEERELRRLIGDELDFDELDKPARKRAR